MKLPTQAPASGEHQGSEQDRLVVAVAHRLDLPWLAVLVAAFVYLGFIVARLSAHGFDPSAFVVAGDAITDASSAAKNLRVLENSYGYDGQFYYRLALEPFTDQETKYGVRFDNAPYRQQRIGYPLIVWALSFGRPELVPFMLIAANYLGLCILAYLAALYAQSRHQHALLGLVLPFYPGLIFSLSRDLAEIVEVCFLVGFLLLVRRQGWRLACACLTAAVLTRETALIVALGCVVAGLVSRRAAGRPHEMPLYVGVVPCLVYAVWQAFLGARWGVLPAVSGADILGVPLAGILEAAARTAATEPAVQSLWYAELFVVAASAIGVGYLVLRGVGPRWARVSWLIYLLLAVSLRPPAFVEDVAFLRALGELYVVGWTILLSGGSQLAALSIGWWSAVWVAVFVGRIRA